MGARTETSTLRAGGARAGATENFYSSRECDSAVRPTKSAERRTHLFNEPESHGKRGGRKHRRGGRRK